jgi:hypothetical protein
MTDSLYMYTRKWRFRRGCSSLGDTVPFDVLLWTEEAGLKSGGGGGWGKRLGQMFHVALSQPQAN